MLRPVATPKKIRAFQRSLLRWYRRHGRDLPWRRTHDPYAILISEFMLQQTQLTTVIPYYNEWLRRFPDFASLARASENDVLRTWQGLGYYARARNLHSTARAVADGHRGRFPQSIEQMRRLPGIGRYTAHAVASFAFDQSVPIVEANTARVLTRLFELRTPINSAAGVERLWQYAARLVPIRKAADFNSALVDLGALVCVPRKPQCPVCPVQKFCRAKEPETLPLKKPRPPMKRLTEIHAFVVRRNRILLQQCTRRWRGMWMLPRLHARPRNRPPIYESIFPFTNHRVALEVFAQRQQKIDAPRDGFTVANRNSQHWIRINSLESIPIPSPHLRALRHLLNEVTTAPPRRRQ